MKNYDFQLIETILYDRDYTKLSFHLDRMRGSAKHFNFPFGEKELLRRLADLKKEFGDSRRRIRVLLYKDGIIDIEYSPVANEAKYRLTISEKRVDSSNDFLYHKTTHRKLYTSELKKARERGFNDILFMNEKGEVTETARANIYIEKINQIFTPPIECGLLGGTMRRKVMNEMDINERVITLEDLLDANDIFVSNAVIGFRKVNGIE